MAVINYDSELRRAGAHSTHGWRRLTFLAQRYMLGTIGLFVMLMFVWVALSADLICRFDPLSVDSTHRLAAPDALHWLGTDSFGRDVWSRIIHGARISLAVGVGSTLLGSSIGVMVGLASGYLSGWVDLVFQRITDILQALPLLVLALVMTAALGPSLPNVIIAIAIPLIPTVARVIRANTLARITRATVGISGIAIAMITFGSDGPSAAVITSASTSKGRACRISVTRWNTRSTQPDR